MMQAGQSTCAPMGERIPPCARAHPFSHRCAMGLARSSALWESRTRCSCAPFLPASDAARQRARQALRAMGASNLLRDSHRVAALAQSGPWLCEPATSAPPGPALLSIDPGKVRAASHPSGELKAGSFTGIPAGRVEAQRDGCPLIRSCMHYRCARPSRLAFRQGGLHSRVDWHLRDECQSFCRSFCMQSHRRYSSTEERDDERATARGETKQSLKLFS